MNPGNGRFRLCDDVVFAKGGFGELLRAQDTEVPRTVAYKRLKAKHRASDSIRAQFKLEAAITGGLQHPGIIPVFGMGEDDEAGPYFTMRLIEDGERFDRYVDGMHADKRKWKSNLTEMLLHFLKVCETVQFAHSRGQSVIHCDLKPQNIMIGPFKDTYVLDWGLATTISGTSGRDTTMSFSPSGESGDGARSPKGTPAYMSPEQIKDHEKPPTRSVDVYGLGAILYQILSNRPPISTKDENGPRSDRAILKDAVNGTIEPLGGPRAEKRIPVPLRKICMHALKLEPSERYQSADEIAADIRRWIDDNPVSVIDERWHHRARRWVRQHSTAVLCASIAMVFALTVATGASVICWSYWQSAERSKQLAIRSRNDLVDTFNWTVDSLEQSLLHAPTESDSREELFQLVANSQEFFDRQELGDAALDERIGITGGVLQMRMGDIHFAEGQFANADKHYRDAAEQLAEIVQRHPGRDARLQLANCKIRHALLQSHTKQPTATAAFDHAVRLLRGLSAEFPDDEGILDSLATALLNEADHLVRIDNWGDAKRKAEQSIGHYSRLSEQRPAAVGYTTAKCQAERIIANAVLHLRQTSSAIAKLNDLMAAYAALLKDNPNHVDLYRERMKTGMLLINAHEQAGNRQAREDAAKWALDDYRNWKQRLVTRYEDPAALGIMHGQIGAILLNQSRNREALRQLQDAVEFLRHVSETAGDRQQLDDILATTLIHLGIVQRELGMFHQSSVSFAEAKQIHGDLYDARGLYRDQKQLAVACSQLGQTAHLADRDDEAEQDFHTAAELLRDVLEARPDDAEAKYYLAHVLTHWCRVGEDQFRPARLKAAEQAWSQLVEQPAVALPADRLDYAWFLIQFRDLIPDRGAVAQQQIEAAIAQLPDDAEYRGLLGVARFCNGEPALELLRDVTTSEFVTRKNWGRDMLYLALALNADGRLDEAKKTLRMAEVWLGEHRRAALLAVFRQANKKLFPAISSGNAIHSNDPDSPPDPVKD